MFGGGGDGGGGGGRGGDQLKPAAHFVVLKEREDREREGRRGSELIPWLERKGSFERTGMDGDVYLISETYERRITEIL